MGVFTDPFPSDGGLYWLKADMQQYVLTLRALQINAELEVLTAVAINSAILCDVTPCSPVQFNPLFEETYCLHLRGRDEISPCSACFSYYSILKIDAVRSSETSVNYWITAVTESLHGKQRM
jgi:hypothetical protein